METERNAYTAANVIKDMAEGFPVKLISGFFIPMLCGLLFQQLYNTTDTIIAGRYLGVKALAVVGPTGSINFMIIGFYPGVCSDFAIPMAQKFEEKNEKALRRFVANSTWLAVLFSTVMTVAMRLLYHNILELMQAPENVVDGAYNYIFVIFLGISAICLYNPLPCIIRSLRDSTVPLTFLVFSSMVNVALGFLTILVSKMGVSEAAWATTTVQAVSGILYLFYMRKKLDILKMNDDERRLDVHHMKTLCNMGVPMGLQHSVTAIESATLQAAVNSLGSMATATVTTGSKISMFFCCPFDALGSTMATYGGQNVSAREPDRIGQGPEAGAVMGCVYAVMALAVLCISGQWITLMLVNKGEGEILRSTRLFLIGNGLFYTPLVFINAVRFMIQGLGYSRLVIIAGARGMAARSFVGFCLAPVFGHIAVCIASPVAQVVTNLFLIPVYRHVMENLDQFFYGRSKATDAAQ